MPIGDIGGFRGPSALTDSTDRLDADHFTLVEDLIYLNITIVACSNRISMSQGMRERLETLYQAVKSGRADFVINAFDDNIEYLSYAPSKVFPYLGHHRGKANVAASLRTIFEEYDFLTYEPIFMVVEDNNAAVMIFARAYHRTTGRIIQIIIAHFLRFRENRIIEIREFMDSFDAVQQLLGRELNIPTARVAN